MGETGEPQSLPKRQLGQYLREAREEQGMSLATAAEHINRSAPTLLRIEKGITKKLQPLEIEALCRLYEFDEEKTEAMKGLAMQANTKNWWHEYEDAVRASFVMYLGLEAAAQEIATYQPDLIPGLLQTPDYARALMRSAFPLEATEEIERRVQLKMRRQHLITRKVNPITFRVIIHEGAIRRVVGGGRVMAPQLYHVADMSTHPNITVQVLPFTAGIPLGDSVGSFIILRFGEDARTVVYAETLAGDLYIEKPVSLRRYAGAYEAIERATLDEASSRSLLRRAAKEHLR
ncbi:helix-turn-helix transcriptional regulator [Nocardia sp. NPDC004604]|uniref:helix-turn-helix domain-containing protein n=1 Tax=Nocardia sp. NPDC004604 TaxID=3157013 RepID=UPI00339EE441